MNLGELRDYVNYISKKEKAGQALNPQEFNLILPVVCNKYFRRMFGLPEDFQPGQPVPAIAFQINQTITDRTRGFLVRKGDPDDIPLMPDVYGKVTLPLNYCHYVSLSYRYVKDGISINKPIDIVTVNERESRIDNPITVPTKKNPIACFFKDYIQFNPIDLQYVNFVYLRLPVKPVYGYTIDPVTDVETYNPAISVQLEFPEESHIDIANLLLKEMGINLRDQVLMGYAEQQKKEGV